MFYISLIRIYNKEIVLLQHCYLVVDVYSDWSGPCTGMVSILKKIKMEIGGDALSYATVISIETCNTKKIRY